MKKYQASGEDGFLDGRHLSYKKTLLGDSLSSFFSRSEIAVWE